MAGRIALLWILLALATACTGPVRLPGLASDPGPRLSLTRAVTPKPAGLRVQISASSPETWGLQALNQPAWQHRAEDVRSLSFELFVCTSLAAAQSSDPAAQAACSLSLSLIEDYPEGFLATTTTFDAGNLKQSRFYTVRAQAYSAAAAGGSLLGTAWPDQPVSLNRIVVGVGADGSLSLSNAAAGADALSLTLQLGSAPVGGGSVSSNRLVVS